MSDLASGLDLGRRGPPVDALPGVDPSLKAPTPVAIDRSPGSLGSALAGTIEKELPAALQQTREQTQAQQAATAETVGDIEKNRALRAQLKAPLPQPPGPPPQPEIRSSGEAWGSIAMVAAMFASAFTRQPLVNALNAGAAVMKAQREGDIENYKINFDRWKQQSDYAKQLYEYQRDSYKAAIESIDDDQKSSLAKLRVISAALKDKPMQDLASAANVAGVIDLARQRDATMQHYGLLNDKARQEGELAREVMEAGAAVRANPNDPAAQQRYQAAQQAARDYHMTQSGGAGAGTQHESKEYEIRDKDGKVVDTVLAREPSQGGLPIDINTGQPIKVDTAAGQTLHKAPTPGSGKQAAQQIQRLTGATAELIPAIENLMAMPAMATLGPFMNVPNMTPDRLADALSRSFIRGNIQGEEAIAINQMFSGVTRELATIQGQGVAQGLVGLTKLDEGLIPQAGWSRTAVARSYAEMRQTIEQNIKAMLASPYVAREQRDLLNQLDAQIKVAVPFTVREINEVSAFGKRASKESVKTFAEKLLAQRKGGAAGGAQPEWATGSATGPNNEKIYTDGKGWFHADHTPVQ